MRIESDDAYIYYELAGKGPDVVLLHPFPANHDFWTPIVDTLASSYRLIMPDLRGHGDSTAGKGPATMRKHAADIARVCDDAGANRAVFVGVSIGGYVLLEFWREYRDRVAALLFSDTKASADSDEARAVRHKAADDVERHGPEQFIEAQLPRLLGNTTLGTRPDLVDKARAMMSKMTAAGIAAVQRGMATRVDSTATLNTITVPSLLMYGEEDELTTIADAAVMNQQIKSSVLQMLPRAGHYAIFEQSEEAGRSLRKWLDSLPRWQ